MTDSRQILICMCHTQHDMGLYYSNLSSEGRVFERTNCSVHNHHAACEFDGFCVLGCADRKARPFHSVDIFVGIDCRFTCNFTAVCSGSSSSTTFSSIGIHQWPSFPPNIIALYILMQRPVLYLGASRRFPMLALA